VAAGKALERELADGLPHDELYVYEDALRRGRSVVIAFIEEDDTIDAARKALASAGAESIDEARENWWIGIRDAEEAESKASGRTFKTDDPSYRQGFEAAMKSQSWWAKQKQMDTAPIDFADEAFRRGYERGLGYCKTLRENRRP
jgi:hypothetical protein